MGIRMPGRNEPCWCGSGAKFKKCHYGRATETAPNYFETINRIHKAAKRGRCLHPAAGGGACGAHAIASHTVQRSGGLAAIAEDGHVLTTFVNAHDMQRTNGAPEPKRIGVNLASTFPGFCGKHDSEVFAPIEQETLQLSQHTAFLFHYRALCLELVRKRHAAEHTLPVLKKADAGQPFPKQLAVQSLIKNYSEGIAAGLADLEAAKADLDRRLLANDWSSVHYVAIEFDHVLPVTATFGIQPEHDWEGNRLQDLSDISLKPEEISLAITSYCNRGYAIFAWIGKSMGIQTTFVDSLLASPDAKWAGSLVNACFELCENTQISPTWWTSLQPDERARLCGKILSGTPAARRDAQGLAHTALVPDPRVVRVVRSKDGLAA
jgi:hypothetical protein